MCFGKSPSYSPPPAPEPTPPPKQDPLPAPLPAPYPVKSAPEPTTVAAEERKKKKEQMRYGMRSTIKTKPWQWKQWEKEEESKYKPVVY